MSQVPPSHDAEKVLAQPCDSWFTSWIRPCLRKDPLVFQGLQDAVVRVKIDPRDAFLQTSRDGKAPVTQSVMRADSLATDFGAAASTAGYDNNHEGASPLCQMR